MVLAHLYQETPHRCRALLLGGLLYLKQATWVDLGQQLVQMVPFPPTPHNVLVVDRGLTSLKLAKPLQRQGLYLLGRVKANATFYLPATEEDYSGHGRRPTYGAKFRADAVPLDVMDRREMPVPVEGQRVDGTIYRGTFLRRGVPDPVDLVRVEVGTLPPWLLLVTDRTLSTEQVIWGYEGRSQVEVALGDCKDLGLDTYRGRREAGIRHWPMIIGVVHSLLQLLAVGAINVTLPPQAWPWYRKETTVGAIQRRVIQWMLRRHFFDLFRQEQKLAEIGKAA